MASGLTHEFEAVRAICLSRNYRQHNALVAGIRDSIFDVVVTMDDHLQHLPEQIPLLPPWRVTASTWCTASRTMRSRGLSAASPPGR